MRVQATLIKLSDSLIQGDLEEKNYRESLHRGASVRGMMTV